MIGLDIKVDTKSIARKLDALARQQMPYAAALAANATAEVLRAAEQENMRKVLNAPTPFTQGSLGIKKATKANPVATVFVKPIAAAYLLPYEVGGLNKLNSKALLKPVNAKVNQYGNLPRNLVQRLTSRPNVFVGKVQTKAGLVDGVWQRTKATRGKKAGLKLLIKFEDAHQTKQRLGYRSLAQKLVPVAFKVELDKALAKALATAR